jgi:PAS domain-containing protein
VIRRKTHRKKKTPRKSGSVSRTVIEQTSEIIINQCDGIIQYVDPAFTQISVFRRMKETIGRTPRMWRDGRQDEAFYKKTCGITFLSGNKWSGLFFQQRKNGSLITAQSFVYRVRTNSGLVS